MNDFQICLCGAQPTYPHTWDCPGPYFGRSVRLITDWHIRREAIRREAQADLENDTRPGEVCNAGDGDPS